MDRLWRQHVTRSAKCAEPTTGSWSSSIVTARYIQCHFTRYRLSPAECWYCICCWATDSLPCRSWSWSLDRPNTHLREYSVRTHASAKWLHQNEKSYYSKWGAWDYRRLFQRWWSNSWLGITPESERDCATTRYRKNSHDQHIAWWLDKRWRCDFDWTYLQ